MANSSYTVEAVLRARDSGFSNAMRAAERSVAGLSNMASKVGSTFKSVLGANLISSALTSGIGSITSGIGSMVGELNGAQKAWKTFEGNLQAFGRSAETISQAKKEMQDFATKTIYSASDMASTYSQLDAVGTKNVGSLVKAFGGLAASAENPAQAMKSLSTQATQMASKPKVAWMDFKIMMEQAPAGMAAVAKEMGMSTAELVSAVQDGKVNTEEFFDALNKAGNSDAFQKMATEFKTVDQAIDGMKESLSNKLMPAFEQLNKFGIKAVNALSDAFDKVDFNKLADGLGKALDKIDFTKIINNVSAFISDTTQKIQTFWTAFSNTGAVSAFTTAVQSISAALGNIWNSLTATGVLETLGSTLGTLVTWLSQIATAAANFIASLPPEVIQGIASAVIGFAGALMTVKTGLKIAQGLKAAFNFGQSLISLVTNTVSLTAAQTANAASSTAMAAGETAVGTSAAASAVSVLQFGAAALMVGAGVALAAAGIYILVQAAIQLASAGAPAAIALAGLTAGIALLAVGAAAIGPALTAGAIGLLAFGAAVLMIGVGVLAAGAGLQLMSGALEPIATYGASAAVGLVALAGGLTLIAAGAGLAAVAGLALGAALVVVGAGALASAAGAVALGAGLVVAAAGVAAFGAALNVGSPAVKTFAEAIKTVSDALSNGIATVLNAVSGVIKSIGDAAQKAGNGFKQLAQGVVMITNTNLGDLAASLAAAAAGITAIANAAAGLGNAGSQISALGQGLMMIQISGASAASALTVVSTVLPTLSTSLTGLAPNLTSAASSLTTFATTARSSAVGFAAIAQSLATVPMQLAMIATSATSATSSMSVLAATVPTVSTGLSTIGASAQVAMVGLISAITSAMTKAVTSVQSGMLVIVTVIRSSTIQMTQAGQQAGQGVSRGVVNGIRSGVAGATAAMNSLMLSVQRVGNIGARNMVNVGTQIGNGLARGMIAALPAVTSAANALVAQAERAARSAADIHSPSRLFRDRVGIFIGQGIAVGIDRSQKFVNEALGNLYDVTGKFDYSSLLDDSLRSQGYSASLNGSLSLESKQEDRKLDIIKDALNTIKQSLDREVVLNVNGQEFARLTGDDFSRYQSDREYISNILKGVRV